MESTTLILQFRSAVEFALKELLEKKHLYQTVRIALDPITEAISKSEVFYKTSKRSPMPSIGTPLTLAQMEQLKIDHRNSLKSELEWLLSNQWKFLAEDPRKIPLRSDHPDTPENEPNCFLPTICRACSHCDAISPPHNPGYFGSQVIEPMLDVILPATSAHRTIQYWTLAYQCQSCRSEPVLFSVRRDREKLQLVGRSLFDRISTPGFIPKHLGRFYSEALIALSAGKPLAGALYLRLLIEHHMKLEIGMPTKIWLSFRSAGRWEGVSGVTSPRRAGKIEV